MNKGEVKPLTSGERASISKFHIVVTPRQRLAAFVHFSADSEDFLSTGGIT